MIVAWPVRTDGRGLYTKKAAVVKVIELTTRQCMKADDEFGRLYVVYDLNTWNPDTDDVIYTDECWLDSLREHLSNLGFSDAAIDAVDYSEHGMQGHNYVDMDIGQPFIGEVFKLGLNRQFCQPGSLQ
jgi:hypothetical protein